jgi:hypothetical protein
VVLVCQDYCCVELAFLCAVLVLLYRLYAALVLLCRLCAALVLLCRRAAVARWFYLSDVVLVLDVM